MEGLIFGILRYVKMITQSQGVILDTTIVYIFFKIVGET